MGTGRLSDPRRSETRAPDGFKAAQAAWAKALCEYARHGRGSLMIAADLIVVGDGIAGCTAAISASRLSLATVMVRSATATRAVDLPETLAPSAAPLLRQ